MKMSLPNQTNLTPDDLLADFTDRVLDGKATTPASPTEDELRGLEETILRLKQTLVQKALDEKTFRHMQADFRIRAQKIDSSASSFWQFLRPRQRLAVAFATVALATLLIVLPFLTFTNEPIQGTAGLQTQGVILLISVVCLVTLFIWVQRRK